MATFPSIRIEGGLLGPDLLDQLLAGQPPGQRATDFGLDSKRNLTDEIAAVFADTRSQWDIFQHRLARVSETDLATSVTRDAWIIPFLGFLGYELKYNQRGYEVEGLTFAISHRAGEAEDSPPVHIVGARQELGRVPPSGRPRLAPHSLVQEYLNRTESVWGLVTNGFILRLLRDTTFVRRQAYVEFDLQGMIEEKRFEDFAALYRLLHRTRLPKGYANAHESLLEKYYSHSIEQGGRVRDHLRDGVEIALKKLAGGFLSHPANDSLRQRVSPECSGNERITPDHFYQQVLRLVYRFLFLLVAEDRGLLGAQELYRENYGVGRLRKLVDSRAAYTHHDDIWRSLRVLWRVLTDDTPQPQLEGKPFASVLGLTVLNGDLFAPVDLDHCCLSNIDLLEAFWSLVWYDDRESRVQRRVNYAALDVEELGSVYESLIEFHPSIQHQGVSFQFDLLPGSERKSTGSYYTPPELVNELIQSALDPVMRDRLKVNLEEKEKALLSIRVCDPACGSGHFLLAAARHLGKELARIRTGQDEPVPEDVRRATREVISHCIYGVDKNPLAVDLCRVALWIESYTEDKPLTFVDHRIRCGDSLLGVCDLESLSEGIPDKAFDAVEGDDRSLARAAARKNRDERQGQFHLPWEPQVAMHQLTVRTREIDQISNDSPEDIRRKKLLFERGHQNNAWIREKNACDLWTASFFQMFQPDTQRITTNAVIEVLSGRSVDGRLIAEAEHLAERLNFFHWPLEFPEVVEKGGFDVVLGNPPWERIKLQEKEFFATRDPSIALATSKAARQRLIRALGDTNRALALEFVQAKHSADATSKFVRHGGRFPLTAGGDINTYALFAELARGLVNTDGCAGVLVPTGISTDETNARFFSDLVGKGHLSRLIDFKNSKGLFPAVDANMRFCVLGMTAVPTERPLFAFFISDVTELSHADRLVSIPANLISLLNPNSHTCPSFWTRFDMELARKVYERVPILRDERTGQDPWAARFLAMFHMSSDSGLFCNEKNESCLRLYESKMFHHYNHRFASAGRPRGAGGIRGSSERFEIDELRDPNMLAATRYFVPESEIDSRLDGYRFGWFIAFRNVTGVVANERTVVATTLPKVGVGNSASLILPHIKEPSLLVCLSANLTALVFDYFARQKVGGLNLNLFILKQLPVLPPSSYTDSEREFIVPRAVELVYTAWDLQPFASDIFHELGPGEWNRWFPRNAADNDRAILPFKWDEDRRALLRAELDAYYARLYGLTRDELRYILDPKEVYGEDFPGETFRVLKEKEIRQFGEYRTRRLVLEAWDKLFT